MEWTLENTTKGGLIDKDKFIDLLRSLAIPCDFGFDIYCVAKMAIKS